MKFIAIIPARYQSTRFPGKPLALLGGKTVIQRVYENVHRALEHVWVATDDNRIVKAVESFGGHAVLTLATHASGTDRCAEAARKLEGHIDFDVVINVQGDEPFVRTDQIEALKTCFDGESRIATLVKKIDTIDELFNPNRPKVVLNNSQHALYFSRSPIPFIRDAEDKQWVYKHQFWAHIGMYAYRKETLQEITRLQQGGLEMAESLEQLRWLENGYMIKTAVTDFQGQGIDTPDDLLAAAELLVK